MTLHKCELEYDYYKEQKKMLEVQENVQNWPADLDVQNSLMMDNKIVHYMNIT